MFLVYVRSYGVIYFLPWSKTEGNTQCNWYLWYCPKYLVLSSTSYVRSSKKLTNPWDANGTICNTSAIRNPPKLRRRCEDFGHSGSLCVFTSCFPVEGHTRRYISYIHLPFVVTCRRHTRLLVGVLRPGEACRPRLWYHHASWDIWQRVHARIKEAAKTLNPTAHWILCMRHTTNLRQGRPLLLLLLLLQLQLQLRPMRLGIHVCWKKRVVLYVNSSGYGNQIAA